MFENKIENLEKEINSNTNISSEKKDELIGLINKLKSELADLPSDNVEKAKSLVNFTESLTHEATREEPNSELTNISLKALELSIKEFEVSHPQLTSTINSISEMLSRIGI
jgi:phosphoenolpyruvate carboxylase